MHTRSRKPRIPPSLKWLIRRRALAVGELAAIAARHAHVVGKIRARANAMIARTHMPYDIAKEKCLQRIAEIDSVMAQHELQIDPTIIKGVRMLKAPRIFEYGFVTAEIRKYMRAAGDRPVSTGEITRHLASFVPYELDAREFKRLKDCTRFNIRSLARKGRLRGVGHEGPPTLAYKLWVFVDPWKTKGSGSKG